MKKSRCLFLLPGVLLPALLLSSCMHNWPQFRGPENNMVAKTRNLPDTWDDETNIRWSKETGGDGWSSPVVWGNRVFLTVVVPVKVTPEPEIQSPPPPQPAQGGAPAARQGQVPPPPPPQEEDLSYLQEVYRWEVSCLDLKSGETLWTQVAFEGSPRIKKHRSTNYASETPVTDGQRLYVYFGMTGLYCYDLNGELVWEKDLGAFNTFNEWGTGSSPVLHEGMLFIQADNEEHSFLVALDAATGEERWRADRDEKTNYSTPVIWKNSVRTELVTGGKTARSYDPASGEILWQLKVDGYYNIPSPLHTEEYLYLGNTAWREIPGTMFCIKAGAAGEITPLEGESTSSGVAWSLRDAPTSNPSLLLYEGLLYQVSSRGGEVTCLDAITGEVVYREKIEGVAACWASPWAHEGKVFLIDEKGVTRVLKAGRNFEVLHQNTLNDRFWASVAVTRDAYLLKGVERLYCIGH